MTEPCMVQIDGTGAEFRCQDETILHVRSAAVWRCRTTAVGGLAARARSRSCKVRSTMAGLWASPFRMPRRRQAAA